MTDQTPENTDRGLRRQAGMPSDTVVVLTTAPDELLAKRIAHVLVEESLAACVHLGAPGVSMYLWQGKLEGGDEVPLTIKTSAGRLPTLYARLRQLHPYEVPEFLVLGVQAGNAEYLDWVGQMTSARGDAGSQE